MRMAKEIEREYNKQLTDLERKATGRPAELGALDARITRQKARLRAGDPDYGAGRAPGGH